VKAHFNTGKQDLRLLTAYGVAGGLHASSIL